MIIAVILSTSQNHAKNVSIIIVIIFIKKIHQFIPTLTIINMHHAKYVIIFHVVAVQYVTIIPVNAVKYVIHSNVNAAQNVILFLVNAVKFVIFLNVFVVKIVKNIHVNVALYVI